MVLAPRPPAQEEALAPAPYSSSTTTAVGDSTGTDAGTNAFAWADIDGDGDLDLAAGKATVVELYKNTGVGTFATKATIAGGTSSSVYVTSLAFGVWLSI